MKIDSSLTLNDLALSISRLWELSGQKIDLIEREYDRAQGSPVYTVAGQ